ncbi:MAG: MFS transporter [Solirubrobacteraceae bacterium]
MIAAVGLVIGPVLGGALVSISWHWVFWFNVPLGLAGGLWGWLVLHEPPSSSAASSPPSFCCRCGS